MKILKIISKSGCPEIILAMSEKTLTFGEVTKLVGHSAIATERLKELKKNRIVNREVMQDDRRTVRYSLTEKGEKIAEALKILEAITDL